MEASTTEKPEETTDGDTHVGRIEEITGVVIEAVFEGHLPEIYNAIECEIPSQEEDGEPVKLVLRGAAAPGRRPRARAWPWTPPTASAAAPRCATPAARSPCPSARTRWAGSSTCSAR